MPYLNASMKTLAPNSTEPGDVDDDVDLVGVAQQHRVVGDDAAAGPHGVLEGGLGVDVDDVVDA